MRAAPPAPLPPDPPGDLLRRAALPPPGSAARSRPGRQDRSGRGLLGAVTLRAPAVPLRFALALQRAGAVGGRIQPRGLGPQLRGEAVGPALVHQAHVVEVAAIATAPLLGGRAIEADPFVGELGDP